MLSAAIGSYKILHELPDAYIVLINKTAIRSEGSDDNKQVPKSTNSKIARKSKRKQIVVSDSECETSDTEEQKLQTILAKYDMDKNVAIVWTHKRQLPSRELQFRSLSGALMSPSDVSSDNITFLCLSHGIVISNEHPGLFVFEYLDGDGEGELHYAPGQIDYIDIDEKTNDVMLTIRFMMEDSQFMSNEINATLSLDTDYQLPLSSLKFYCCHLTTRVQEELMPKYKLVIREWYKRYSWRQVGLLRGFFKQAATMQADLYDFLELYYVQDKYVWRTALGTFIWDMYIRPICTFGVKPRMDLVSRVMSMKNFDVLPFLDAQEEYTHITCAACGKADVVSCAEIPDKNGTEKLGFGCVCAERLECLHKIGKAIQDFREANFDVRNFRNLLHGIRLVFEGQKLFRLP